MHWGTNVYPLSGDKCISLIGGQMYIPYWGTNAYPLSGDKCISLLGGQMYIPYWGTNAYLLLGDKCVSLIGGTTVHISLIGGQMHIPYWGIQTPYSGPNNMSDNYSTFLTNKLFSMIWKTQLHCTQTNLVYSKWTKYGPILFGHVLISLPHDIQVVRCELCLATFLISFGLLTWGVCNHGNKPQQ